MILITVVFFKYKQPVGVCISSVKSTLKSEKKTVIDKLCITYFQVDYMARGSVATRLRCDGIFNDYHLIAD